MAHDSVAGAVTPSFDVFISYSHTADHDLAPALQRGLARLAKPWNQPRALRVFRDQTDLSAAHALTDEIESALDRSRYFLLLASPDAAGSEWVAKEVQYWIDRHPSDTLLIAVTDGEAVWKGDDFDWSVTTAVPETLRGYFTREPLWVDLRFARDKDQRSLRHSGFRSAVASLAAPPRGVPKEQLDSADVRQHRVAGRLRASAIVALVLLLVVSAVAGAGFLMQRNEARQQRDVAIARDLVNDSEKLATTAPSDARFDSLAAWQINDSPDSRYAMLAAAANRTIGRLAARSGPVLSIAFSPTGDKLAAGGTDQTVRLWDVATGRQIGPALTGHRGSIGSVAFSADGTILATASGDGTVRLWNVDTRTALGDPISTGPENQDGSGYGVPSVAFGNDNRTLAITGGDGILRIWNIATRQQVGDSLAGGTVTANGRGWVNAAEFSHDGKFLATAGADHVTRLFDAATHREIRAFVGHGQSVFKVYFSQNDELLLTSGVDGTARLWSVAGGVEVGPHIASTVEIAPAVAIAPDGTSIATGGFGGVGGDRDVQWWDRATMEQIGETFIGHTAGVSSVAFSPSGRLLATAGWDGEILLWDVANRRPVGAPLTTPDSWVWAMAFTPDGKTLVTAGTSGKVRFVNASTGIEDGDPMSTRIVSVRSMAISPDGSTLAAVGDGGDIVFADVASRRELDGRIATGATMIWTVAYSPDGRTLVTAGDDHKVRFWDVVTRRETTGDRPGSVESMTSTPDNAGSVEAIAFDPRGALLATADNVHRVRFWSAATHLEVGESINIGGVRSIAFSPDGTILATAGDGHTARLWDVATRRQIGAPLAGYTFGLGEVVTFNPAGKTLASVRYDTQQTALRLWDIDFTTDVVSYLCHTAGTSFTLDQWTRLVPAGPSVRRVCP